MAQTLRFDRVRASPWARVGLDSSFAKPDDPRMGLSRDLYRAARISNTMSAIESGNPWRIAHRGGNVFAGRSMARAGVGPLGRQPTQVIGGASSTLRWPVVGRGMFGRLAACLAVWVLALSGAAGASVVGASNVIYQGTSRAPARTSMSG